MAHVSARRMVCKFATFAVFGVHAPLLWAASPGSDLDVHARPVFGPLPAGQIAQIQTLGRAVLVAKHNQQPSVEEQALVSELRALSQDIDNAAQDPAQKIDPAASVVSKGGAAARIPAARPDVDARDRLLPHLERLHERRARIEHAPSGSSGSMGLSSNEAGYQSRMQRLSQAVADIERSVQLALALPEAQRRAKLVELSRQYKPSGQHAWTRARADDAASPEKPSDDVIEDIVHPAPTLRTLTGHEAPALPKR